MTRWTDYQAPCTLEAALQTLEESPDPAIIAGGTDLLLDLDQGRHPQVRTIIDISDITELHRQEIENNYVVIGSAVPLSKILENNQVQEHAPGLIEACKLIGGPQVRNVATLGGNVAHALPAADGTIALLSLGAEAQLATGTTREWVQLPSLFAGPGEVTFDRRQTLISALRFRLRGAYEGSAFKRVMRPQGVAIAIMNMGVWLRCDEAGKILSARIAVGPGGPVPFLAEHGSAALIGHALDDNVLEKAIEGILTEAKFRTSKHRSSKAYREHLVSALLHQTLSVAYHRALKYESL